MNPLTPLYLIADQATCGERPLPDVLARALDAGVRLVQLREKNLGEQALRALAETVLTLTARYDAALLLNTHAKMAVQLGAQGVHLPSEKQPGAMRARFGPSFLIGYSAHSPGELALAEGADFAVYSPVFAPGSKPGYTGPEVGLTGLRQAVAQTALPIFALGGITPERARACRQTGCAGVAVMSGILAAPDPGKAAQHFIEALTE